MITDYREMICDTLPINRKTLLKTLKNIKLKHVTIHYEGCGDSGGMESIRCEPELKSEDLENHQVNWQAPEHVEVDGNYHYQMVTKTLSLKDALEQVTTDWVYSLYPGWENNDGAYGDVEIVVKTGEVFLNHNEYTIETYSHEHVM